MNSALPILRRRSAVFLASSLLVATAASLLYVRGGTKPNDAGALSAPPPEVTTATVTPTLFTEKADVIGRVEAFDSVEIRPRVSGHISQVNFRAGSVVKAGDVLFTLDDRYYRAEVNLAAAAVEQARVHKAVAEREAARAKDLFASEAISAEEAESRKGRFEEASAALLAAEATLARAQLDLDYTQVRAPIDGRVSRALVTQGNLVSGNPGSGTLLTTVVSEGAAYVYADIDENTLLRFNRFARDSRLPLDRDGRIAVEMQLADESGYPRHGYIESRDNRLAEGTGSLVFRMVFPNTDGALVPGLFARVRIPVAAPENSVVISEQAIGTDQSQKFVFTVDENNTVSYRAVTLGPVREGQRVIRSGLKSGERVIIAGVQRVRPGILVNPHAAEPEGASVATLK